MSISVFTENILLHAHNATAWNQEKEQIPYSIECSNPFQILSVIPIMLWAAREVSGRARAALIPQVPLAPVLAEKWLQREQIRILTSAGHLIGKEGLCRWD